MTDKVLFETKREEGLGNGRLRNIPYSAREEGKKQVIQLNAT